MDAFERSFTLHVPSSTENLAMIRDFVASIGAKAGFDENEAARITLAVDEACANVIEHAYSSEDTHAVTIRATLDNKDLVFDIIDNGRGFVAGDMAQVDVEELIRQRKSGGLGLRLIRAVMDEVNYQITPGEKNELHMVKRLHRG
ncbi:MAG TPA: ATP-binding protein [Bryobacteraceae bacterium]|nr:ATP-binding protein [Bryobacteraceae bacterium]